MNKFNVTFCPTFLTQMSNTDISFLQKRSLLALIKYVSIMYKDDNITTENNDDYLFKIKYSNFVKTLPVRPSSQDSLKKDMEELAKKNYVVNLMGKESSFVFTETAGNKINKVVMQKEHTIKLIRDFDIQNGIIKFRLSDVLEQAIKSYSAKTIDAKTTNSSFVELDNNIMNKIKSKFTLNLYMFIASYQGVVNAKNMNLGQAKKIFGTNNTTQQLCHFRKQVIDKSVDELKKESIGIKVSADIDEYEIVKLKILEMQKIIRKKDKVNIVKKNEKGETIKDNDEIPQDVVDAIYEDSLKNNVKNQSSWMDDVIKKYIKKDKSTVITYNKLARVKKFKKLLEDFAISLDKLRERDSKVENEITEAYVNIQLGGWNYFTKEDTYGGDYRRWFGDKSFREAQVVFFMETPEGQDLLNRVILK